MEKPASAERSATVRITRCHCPKCAIAVHVHATPAPVVCPYCRRPLDRGQADVAVAPAADFPSLEEALQVLSRLRHWQVIEKGEIAADVDYVASTRLRLDPSQMAKTFQVSALSNRDWSQSSEWLVWNFSPSEAAAAPGTGDAK